MFVLLLLSDGLVYLYKVISILLLLTLDLSLFFGRMIGLDVYQICVNFERNMMFPLSGISRNLNIPFIFHFVKAAVNLRR